VVLPPGALLTLILLGAALLHWSALRVSFFADDFMFLEQVRSRSFLGALLSPDPISNFFRPVGRQLYFWLIGHLSSESPAAFHAVNLVVFLGLLSLLFVVVRRLAGVAAATVACAFLALHYAADVPLRWVSGSQELLAVAGALGAIALHLSGRRVAAAAVMLLALLSKESVALAPLVAIAADRVRQPSWRRAFARGWPMAAALGVWGALWVITAHQRRATSGSGSRRSGSSPCSRTWSM
jgi:hypothetical protein